MRLVMRETANFDIEHSFNEYFSNVSVEVATKFVMAIDAALAHITDFPGTGSLRYAQLLDIPGLRFWLTTQFPFVVFYIQHKHHLDVIRVLHQRSNISAQLRLDLLDFNA
jgi:toxin ParE1/3/4